LHLDSLAFGICAHLHLALGLCKNALVFFCFIFFAKLHIARLPALQHSVQTFAEQIEKDDDLGNVDYVTKGSGLGNVAEVSEVWEWNNAAETIESITEKDLRENRRLLIGRKIKRFFPGIGGSWGIVEDYDVKRDLYTLRYDVDGYREWLAFEDVLKILPKSWFKKLHEANMTSLVNELARCAHAKCFLAEDKPAHRLDHSQFFQPDSNKEVLTFKQETEIKK
jgi:hypothetical protein